MRTDSQIRSQLIRKIRQIPDNKIREVDDYVSKLMNPPDKKSEALSFAGTWGDIDDSTFQELTSDLIRKRQRNKPRISEQNLD